MDYTKIAEAARKCIKEDGKRSKKNNFRIEYLDNNIAVFEQNANKSSVYAQMHSSGKMNIVWVIDLTDGFNYKAIGLSFDGESWLFGAADEYHDIGEFNLSGKRKVNGLPIFIYYDEAKSPKVFEIQTGSNIYRVFKVIAHVNAISSKV